MSAECVTLPFELPTLSPRLQRQTNGEKVTKLPLVDRAKEISLEPVKVSGRLTVSF